MTGLARLTLPFPQIAAGACALSLLTGAFAGIQTYRMHSAHVALTTCRSEREQIIAASKIATDLQRRANAAKERQYQEHAHEADQRHDAELADVRSATDRYIADHRVRSPSGGSTATAAPSPARDSAGVPQDVPADSDVAVADGDVRACSEAVKYGIDAHDWAVGLEK